MIVTIKFIGGPLDGFKECLNIKPNQKKLEVEIEENKIVTYRLSKRICLFLLEYTYMEI